VSRPARSPEAAGTLAPAVQAAGADAKPQVRWNACFILEVMYFYPYAKRLRIPETLKETALLLCDAEHLASIVTMLAMRHALAAADVHLVHLFGDGPQDEQV